jgi:hypothetical protein
VDHVLVSPCGTAVVVADTKAWRRSWSTTVVGGRVQCGPEDRHGEAEKVAKYAATVSRLLGLPPGAVWPILVVHGSPVAGGRAEARVVIWSGPVWVLAPEVLVPTLRAAPAGRNRAVKVALARRVEEALPAYRS